MSKRLVFIAFHDAQHGFHKVILILDLRLSYEILAKSMDLYRSFINSFIGAIKQ